MLTALKYLYRAYRYRYRIDPVEIAYITRNLNVGDTAVDIGCHKGGYLYWMRKSVGTSGRCYAFEPQPNLHRYLQQVLQTFSYPNVTLENKGLSSSAGTFQLYIPKTASGSSPGASLNNLSKSGASIETVEVETVTLDSYFLERGIGPKLIKIDVEGHEAEVLKGGEKLLQKHRPRIIMECESRHLNGGSVMEVAQILLDWGYSGFFIQGPRLISIEAFDPAIHQKQEGKRFWEAADYVNNFVFE